MPKYWVKNYFAQGRFPEVGQKQKTEKREREKEERKLVKTMAKLRMAHSSTHGARKHAWRTQAAWAKMHECVLQRRRSVMLVASECIAQASGPGG